MKKKLFIIWLQQRIDPALEQLKAIKDRNEWTLLDTRMAARLEGRIQAFTEVLELVT